LEIIEEPTHAFILRIWVEHSEEYPAEPVWRGVMQHVVSGERVYFARIDEVGKHLMAYLESIGIKPDSFSNSSLEFKKTSHGGSSL